MSYDILFNKANSINSYFVQIIKILLYIIYICFYICKVCTFMPYIWSLKFVIIGSLHSFCKILKFAF